jgi:hypothetical protein
VSNGDLLEDALRAEFGPESGVLFQAVPPTVFTAPSVVVTPGDPFLSPATHGALVLEAWEVLVVVAVKEVSVGVEQMGDLSRRVRRAAGSVGALWEETSGPRVPAATDSRGFVFVINRVSFKTQG